MRKKARTSRKSNKGHATVDKIQSFEYKGTEYKWRILEASLRGIVEREGKRIESLLVGHTENTIRLLYHLVCWCGKDVGEEEFVEDWRCGWVRFRLNPREKQTSDIYRSIRDAAVKYNLY